MFCYKCGCELGKADYCPNCGTDVKTYKRIIWTSNELYNDGLEKAQVRDLSGAILSLKEALWFNKDNLDARNLLGLIYYEIGETVAALSEWVISENINQDRVHAKDNPGERYLKEVQKNRQEAENINISIRRYNHAIECCHSDNLDVALLELKKVLSLNPHYLRARQLLALLYIQRKEYRMAERELRKCLRLDINNTTSLRYLQEVETALSSEVNPERRRRGAMRRTAHGRQNAPKPAANGTVQYKAANETIIQPVGSKVPGVDGFSLPGGITGGIIGLIIGAALVAFLVMPARVQSVRSAANEQVRTVSAQLDTKDSTISDLQDQLNTLRTQQARTQDTTTEATDDTRTANDNGLFATANAYINNPSDNDTLTDVFVAVDPDTALTDASQEFTDLYNNLYTKLQSPMLERYAWAGINEYEGDSPDYETVIYDLVVANKYEDPNAWSMTYVERLYYLADSYNRAYNAMDTAAQANSDYQEQAKKYAQMVVENFPDSNYVNQCTQLLSDLGVDVSSLRTQTSSGTGSRSTQSSSSAASGTGQSQVQAGSTGNNTSGNSRTTQAAQDTAVQTQDESAASDDAAAQAAADAAAEAQADQAAQDAAAQAAAQAQAEAAAAAEAQQSIQASAAEQDGAAGDGQDAAQ